MKTRSEVDTALDRLEAALPQMLAEFGATNVMQTFMAIGEDLRVQVRAQDHVHVWARIQSMLHHAGLIPNVP